MRPGMLGGEVPGHVKRLSVEKLLELSGMALKSGLHAVGNPTWVQEKRQKIKYIFAHPLTWKGAGEGRALRCYIGVVVDPGLFAFTMDIQGGEFEALDSVVDPWEISENVLNYAPFVSQHEG